MSWPNWSTAIVAGVVILVTWARLREQKSAPVPVPAPPPIDPAAKRKLAADLRNAGYFSYVESERLTEVFAAAEEGDLYDESIGRVFNADAEDLAEGSVERFLGEVKPALERCGVAIDTVSQEVEAEKSDRQGYSVTVNGERHVIYSHDEAVDKPDATWDLAPRRTFQLINALLQNAGSAERMYMLNGGNDCFAWLLTKEQYNILTATPALKERDKPVSC